MNLAICERCELRDAFRGRLFRLWERLGDSDYIPECGKRMMAREEKRKSDGQQENDGVVCCPLVFADVTVPNSRVLTLEKVPEKCPYIVEHVVCQDAE